MHPRGAWVGLLVLGSWACVDAPALAMSPDSVCECSVPITFEGGVPVAPIEVNGDPLTLLVDTGGFDTISLGTSVLDGVKPAFTGKTRKFAVGRGDTLKAREYLLTSVSLGEHRFTDVVGSEFLFPADLPPAVPAGYVGLGLLRRLRLTIDYGRGELDLVDRRCAAPEPTAGATWHKVRMDSDKDGPRITVMMDGHKRSLLLDTGASYSTIRPGAAPKEMRRQAQGWELYTPKVLETRGGEIASVELAVIELPGPGTDGILGCNFFAEHQVVLDFDEHEVAFRRTAPPEPHPCPPPPAD